MGCWWIDGGLPILERPAEAAAARERPGSARNEIEALLGREWRGERRLRRSIPRGPGWLRCADDTSEEFKLEYFNL